MNLKMNIEHYGFLETLLYKLCGLIGAYALWGWPAALVVYGIIGAVLYSKDCPH